MLLSCQCEYVNYLGRSRRGQRLTLEPGGSASILGAQCSCSWVESRDRACVSEPPTRWKPDRSLSPADIWTALVTRVVSDPRIAFRRTHCRHPNTERTPFPCPIFPTLDFPRLFLAPSPQKATRRPRRFNYRPSRRCSAGAICAASRKPAPARPPPSRCQSSSASPPFDNERRRKHAAPSCWVRRGSWRARSRIAFALTARG